MEINAHLLCTLEKSMSKLPSWFSCGFQNKWSLWLFPENYWLNSKENQYIIRASVVPEGISLVARIQGHIHRKRFSGSYPINFTNFCPLVRFIHALSCNCCSLEQNSLFWLVWALFFHVPEISVFVSLYSFFFLLSQIHDFPFSFCLSFMLDFLQMSGNLLMLSHA